MTNRSRRRTSSPPCSQRSSPGPGSRCRSSGTAGSSRSRSRSASSGAADLAGKADHLTWLDRVHEIVREIRRANDRDEFSLATRLSEHLGQVLNEDPEHLLKTKELAHWKFSAAGKTHGDRLAAAALDEIRARVLELGPSASWH